MENILTMNPYLLLAIVFWTIPWKAWALWLSARRGDIWWFLAILILSTFAILDIVYIFMVAKQSDKTETETDKKV